MTAGDPFSADPAVAPARRRAERAPLTTELLLRAIAAHGPHWPAVIAPDFAQRVIDAAMNREFLSGNLLDGTTLSAQGRALLRGEVAGLAAL